MQDWERDILGLLDVALQRPRGSAMGVNVAGMCLCVWTPVHLMGECLKGYMQTQITSVLCSVKLESDLNLTVGGGLLLNSTERLGTRCLLGPLCQKPDQHKCLKDTRNMFCGHRGRQIPKTRLLRGGRCVSEPAGHPPPQQPVILTENSEHFWIALAAHMPLEQLERPVWVCGGKRNSNLTWNLNS